MRKKGKRSNPKLAQLKLAQAWLRYQVHYTIRPTGWLATAYAILNHLGHGHLALQWDKRKATDFIVWLFCEQGTKVKWNLRSRRGCKPKTLTVLRPEWGFYGTREWFNIRYEAFKAYGRRCVLCGSTGELHVDHIQPRSKRPDLELDLSNLQILCSTCNVGKSNKDDTNWRLSVG